MTSTESTATVTALVKDLRGLALDLEKDLKVRARDDESISTRLTGEYEQARAAERTAAGYTEWLGGRVTQAAAAWVLSTVFVRYCEDNGLIERPFLSGPDGRSELAEDYQNAFITENPTLNNRDWLEAAFQHIADAHPTAAGLFDAAHNPLWDITISYEAANSLIAFWRRRDDSGTEIRYSFKNWDTRFLGDLYQDLSEAARKTYALLQTPEFVEEFILDLTLDPAVEEFGLEGLRTIDPASGSGHFLLGLFRRILAKWRELEPGTDDWELIRRSMQSVHGCDKNPFATSIARFRLLVAALDAAGENRLDRAGLFPINVAVGDSLIHGRRAAGNQLRINLPGAEFTYVTEDIYRFVNSCDLLGPGSYHVVVGNPPYITVKDRAENSAYRIPYKSCVGKYALSVPFTERLFGLAVRADGASTHAGFVGQITANSFMKREFGRKLIEDFLTGVHLTHVIDTSGAYIPGHGTPTVILVGRNHWGREAVAVRGALGVRGEPAEPEDPANGVVWQAIRSQIDFPGAESEWVTVENLERQALSVFPWNVSGGGSAGLVADLEQASSAKCGDYLGRSGFFGITGFDELALATSSTYARWGISEDFLRVHVAGDEVRDWRMSPREVVWYPYDGSELVGVDAANAAKHFWAFRAFLGGRRAFSGNSYAEDGRPWWAWHQLPDDSNLSSMAVVWSQVATHGHFALGRYPWAYNSKATIMRLRREVDEGTHLALLAVLNSSTSTFWLKQVCYPKGGDPIGNSGARVSSEGWSDRFEYTGSKLPELPLPKQLPLDSGRVLDSLAEKIGDLEPFALVAHEKPTRSAFGSGRAEHTRLRERMIALQEELDWEVYRAYELLSEAEAKSVLARDPEPLNLGERAFEIVLARKVAAGEAETGWFERHRSTPITELPAHWAPEYKAVVEARIALIESRRDLALIERPECKRRWSSELWEKKERAALETWLLDRCEDHSLWFSMRDGMEQPRTLTISQLADRFPPDSDMHSVANLYAQDHLGRRDMTLAQVLEQVIADEHVPYLAAMRYKDSGLEKRAEWERTWEGQREEDRTGKSLHLAVPPKYKPADFRKPSYWSHRGKLDVPKERFISYLEASPDADPTLLLGWAGWDHKDQAQALVNLVNDRGTQAGWPTERLVPLLAGLVELMPWVHQWHGEYDPEWDGTPAEEYQTFLDQQRNERQLTEQSLADWRPAAPTRGRRARRSS